MRMRIGIDVITSTKIYAEKFICTYTFDGVVDVKGVEDFQKGFVEIRRECE